MGEYLLFNHYEFWWTPSIGVPNGRACAKVICDCPQLYIGESKTGITYYNRLLSC